MIERVNPKNVRPTNIGDGLWVNIKKRLVYDKINSKTKNITDKIYWKILKRYKYEECYDLFAQYGKGGAILTTSQMAYYCYYLGGVGEYLVDATQKGIRGRFFIMRFSCYDDGWIMYPRLSDKVLSSKKFQREYHDEYEELRDLKEEINQIRKGIKMGDIEGLLEQIRDILDIIDSGKEFYEEEYIEKSKIKKSSRSNIGVKPFMRDIFPKWQKHVYHYPKHHEIFPASGRIIERDGVIYEKPDNQGEKEEMARIINGMGVKVEESNDELNNLVRDLSKEDYTKKEDDWLNKSFK